MNVFLKQPRPRCGCFIFTQSYSK